MNFLFFDTETSGLPRYQNAPAWLLFNWPRVIQIGWVLTDEKGAEINSGCRLIKPSCRRFTPESIALHGITVETAKRDGENIKQVLLDFCQDLERADVAVAHNIRFDEMVLRAEFFRTMKRNRFRGKRMYCTMRETTEFCAFPQKSKNQGGPTVRSGFKWPSLIELHKKLFNSEFEQHHNALADCRACLRCFWELKRLGVF